MSNEQLNLRLEPDLVEALEKAAREESLDRATMTRRLLRTALAEWRLTKAIKDYIGGAVSIERAAEDAGISLWDLMERLKKEHVAYPMGIDDVNERVEALRRDEASSDQMMETLPDIPPRPGGVLIVGINPAPRSVAAGHYYQGALGRRLWKRLEHVGLLRSPIPGAEDRSLAEQGHGLTDLVKRPTASAQELSSAELRDGIENLRRKVREWQPSLIIFPFKRVPEAVFGRGVRPGFGPALENVPTFLFTGPYAKRSDAEVIDRELSHFLLETKTLRSLPPVDDHAPPTSRSQTSTADSVLTQRVTRNDLNRGQIRLPRAAKQFFPAGKSSVEVLLRGYKIVAKYDPRLGPDRERSAVLRVGSAELRRLVNEGDILRVSKQGSGAVRLA
jgi:TDG/mug DNA glycosylase family protein